MPTKHSLTGNNFRLVTAIIFMLLLALFRELFFFPSLDTIPNPDVSWLLYAAGRVADGQRLYIDIMETNPPLIVWLYLIPVWIGNFLGISVFSVFPFLVTLLNILSLYLIAKTMKRQELLGDRSIFYVLLLYIAFGFFLLSPAVYGQRELLFITLVLPYLIKTHGDDEEERFSISGFVIIVMAAIGFAIKPFFMLLWGMNELHNAVQKRSISPIFSFRNWVIGFFQLAYLLAIYYFTPEYITTIVPTVLITYFTYEVSWYAVGKIILTVLLVPIILVFIAKPHGDFKKIITRVMVWTLSAAMLVVLQRKDWLNHLYPMVFMAGLLIAILLVYLMRIWRELGLLIGYRRFTAICTVIVTLLSVIYVDAKFWYFIYEKPLLIHKKLLVEIDKQATGKYVYPLAYNLQSGFPVISLSKGIFRGSFHHLWPLTGLLIREQQEVKTPELKQARQFFYDTIVRDFSNFPPDLVWVDDNVNMAEVAGYAIEAENRDIIAVLRRDVRFAVMWNDNYEKIGEIEGEISEEEELVDGEEKRQPERYSLYKRIIK